MHLVVVSHKPCWPDADSASGYATDGGFPFQMQALAQLFERTTLLVTERSTPAPTGLTPLQATSSQHDGPEQSGGKYSLDVHALPEPPGLGLRRKLALLLWLPRHLPALWRTLRRADVVHAAVPGDLGTLGLLIALVQRKRVFVRHCGTWGNRATTADRFLAWLLPRIAEPHPAYPKRVVLATGGPAPQAPQDPPQAAGKAGHDDVHWIFSTSLRQAQLAELTPAPPWTPGQTLRLVFAGRLSAGKNVDAGIRAVQRLRAHLPLRLDIFGAGPHRDQLATLIEQLSRDEPDFADAVTLHGNRPHAELLQQLCRGHLFVFPTRVAEGFPKAVLEALACGLPVLAPAVSVLPHLLEPPDADPAGVVLPAATADAVADAVLDLTADPERLARLAATARHRAENYTLERWRDTIGEHLRAAWQLPLRIPSSSSSASTLRSTESP